MYGAVPPVGVTDALPLEAPQVASTVATVAVSNGGCVMVVLAVAVQPLASRIATV